MMRGMGEPDPPILGHCASHDEIQPIGCTGRAVAWTIGIGLGLLLLIMIILPQLGTAKEGPNRVKCASNMQQLAQSVALYRNDYHVWPQTLGDILIGGDLNPDFFTCPSSSAEQARGLTIQEAAQTLTDPKHGSYIYYPPPPDAGDLDPKIVLMVERPENHKGDGMNVLFADGHVEWFRQPDFQRVLAELQAGHNPPRWPATQPISTSASGTGRRQ